jgi:hypothetical protein
MHELSWEAQLTRSLAANAPLLVAVDERLAALRLELAALTDNIDLLTADGVPGRGVVPMGRHPLLSALPADDHATRSQQWRRPHDTALANACDHATDRSPHSVVALAAFGAAVRDQLVDGDDEWPSPVDCWVRHRVLTVWACDPDVCDGPQPGRGRDVAHHAPFCLARAAAEAPRRRFDELKVALPELLRHPAATSAEAIAVLATDATGRGYAAQAVRDVLTRLSRPRALRVPLSRVLALVRAWGAAGATRDQVRELEPRLPHPSAMEAVTTSHLWTSENVAALRAAMKAPVAGETPPRSLWMLRSCEVFGSPDNWAACAAEWSRWECLHRVYARRQASRSQLPAVLRHVSATADSAKQGGPTRTLMHEVHGCRVVGRRRFEHLSRDTRTTETPVSTLVTALTWDGRDDAHVSFASAYDSAQEYDAAACNGAAEIMAADPALLRDALELLRPSWL